MIRYSLVRKESELERSRLRHSRDVVARFGFDHERSHAARLCTLQLECSRYCGGSFPGDRIKGALLSIVGALCENIRDSTQQSASILSPLLVDRLKLLSQQSLSIQCFHCYKKDLKKAKIA